MAILIANHQWFLYQLFHMMVIEVLHSLQDQWMMASMP